MSLLASAAVRAARRLEPHNPQAAARLLRTAARGPSRGALTLRALAAETALRSGVVPPELPALRAELAAAAGAAAGRVADDAELLTRLAALTFHRVEHLDGPGSPLAADPASFLAPLRSSPGWLSLVAPRGFTPRRRPVGRVVVITDGDRRFLDPLLPHLGVEVDVVSLTEIAGVPLTPGEQVRARLDPRVAEQPWGKELTRRVGDADAVWVEWCQRAAVLASLLPLGGAPMVVRLHAFEAFTVFPHLVDPSRISSLVTVSPAFAGLVRAVVPALADKVTVIPNALDPAPFARPRTADRVLGVLGWGAPAKDACWAVDVLAELRRHDPAWQLRLVGAAPDAATTGSRAYAAAVRARAALPDVAGAVELAGPTLDAPATLSGFSALVSSSTRESFHLAVGEAAAAGCRVAVREWPTLSPYGGPHGVWPADWIVDTPQEAAALILSGEPQSPAPDYRPEVVGTQWRELLHGLG